MPRLRDIEGATIADARGRRYGRVEHLLFHPTEPRPIGLQVERPRLLYVIPRSPAFVPLGVVRIAEGALALTAPAPSAAAGEREIGAPWDATVVWRGMPVRSQGGNALGLLRDADVSVSRAELRSVTLTEGSLADVAVGQHTIAAEFLLGFDGESVVIADAAFAQPKEPGGLAAKAGTSAAYAKVGAERAAANAAAAGAAAAKAIKRAEIPRKTGKLLGTLGKRVLDAMRDEDEE